MIQSLIIALGKSLLIWIGMQILLDKKYKWSALIFYMTTTAIFSYCISLFVDQGERIALFIFAFLISNLRKDGWISEAKENFFYLAIVRMLMLLGRAWADLIAYRMHGFYSSEEFYEQPLALLFNITICFSLFFLAGKLLRKAKITGFIGRMDDEYQTLLASITGVILFCYYAIIFVPVLFNINCSGMTKMHPIYMTLLTLIAAGLILLFSAITKKEMLLIRRNASLAHVNAQLRYKQQEMAEKEGAIKALDNHIMSISDIEGKLRDFAHGQRELLIIIAGAFESGDKALMYKLLEEYNVKVQEASEHRTSFPDIKQIKAEALTPLRFYLYAKANEALEKSIDFTVEIPREIQDIGMPISDFTEILGVWLNNAIEEAMHTEEKRIHISLILDENLDGSNTLELRVTNSCREDALDPTLDDHRGASTKGAEHGNGLLIVDKAMAKHAHICGDTEISDGKFMQLLEIEFIDETESENEEE